MLQAKLLSLVSARQTVNCLERLTFRRGALVRLADVECERSFQILRQCVEAYRRCVNARGIVKTPYLGWHNLTLIGDQGCSYISSGWWVCEQVPMRGTLIRNRFSDGWHLP